MDIKEQDYASQRKEIRSKYDHYLINENIQREKQRLKDIYDALFLMKELEFDSELIDEYLHKLCIDGYIAFRKIKADGKIISLKELDPINIIPTTNENLICIENEEETVLEHKDVIYLSNSLFFNETINLIDTLNKKPHNVEKTI